MPRHDLAYNAPVKKTISLSNLPDSRLQKEGVNRYKCTTVGCRCSLMIKEDADIITDKICMRCKGSEHKRVYDVK